MVIKTINGYTTLEGGDAFTIIKFLTMFIPNISKYDKELDIILLRLNIIEAVIDDIISNKQIPNAIFGVNLMLFLPIMKEIQIIDCEGMKIWFILYFIWNMRFCKNKGFGTQESFAHNFPALIRIMLSFGYTPTQLLSDWRCNRGASITTSFIDHFRF